MIHHNDPDLLNTVLQRLTTQGSSNLAECFRLLLNEAMRLERAAVLQAQPYERCEGRLGHANGFKPKTLATRMGKLPPCPDFRGKFAGKIYLNMNSSESPQT